MKLVLYSLDDLAGCNIAKVLVEKHGFKPDGGVWRKGDVLLAPSQTNVKDVSAVPYSPEVCIVASRHRSESGRPTLTCHPTGNFGSADLGGLPQRLQLTEARYLRQCLLLLQKRKAEEELPYEVSMEVTHHGPSELPFPLLYVEVGSSKEQWSDVKACTVAADVIHAVMFGAVEDKPSALGFGGPHYAPNFIGVKEYALGHIMSKHALVNLTSDMVYQMIEKTHPTPKVALFDWKGISGGDRDKLRDILKAIGLEYLRTSDVK